MNDMMKYSEKVREDFMGNIKSESIDGLHNVKEKNANIKFLISVIFECIYICFTFILGRHGGMIEGVLAQVQVMIVIILTLTLGKKGYIISLLLLCFSIGMTCYAIFYVGNPRAVSGLAVTLCTAIVCTIIMYVRTKLEKEIKEKEVRNKELSSLYNEVSIQNERLLEYNDIVMKNEKELNQLSFYDLLTELPNRKMILSSLEFLIHLSELKNIGFSVVLIDLDNFKFVNDTKGHHIGDALLRKITELFSNYIVKDDLVGRLGGDEFALVIQRELTKDELIEYIGGIKNLLAQPIILDGEEITISASFGVATYPEDAKTASELLKYADIAMYQVKYSGKNGICFFHKSMNEEMLEKIELENQLTNALQNNELYLVYQPQYFLDKKVLYGFEALTRWNSERFGIVSPAKFIPIAEEAGFIISMGEWILKTACEEAVKIKDIYKFTPRISVNISAVQIMHPDFLDKVQRIIDSTGIDTTSLEFEITESIFISSMQYVVDILHKVRALGILISLDDFGTGYSSLSYLQMLPIDILKIDKSFVDKIDDASDKKQIVGALIDLMHQLDLKVVAEGVEKDSQLDYLREHNCDIIQGYIWGKPQSIEEIYKVIETSRENKTELD